jgi:hypothetical protein
MIRRKFRAELKGDSSMKPEAPAKRGLVLALCLIAAAAATSLLAGCGASGGANEAAVAGNLFAYANAQSMYRRTDWDKNGNREYARPFTKLHSQKDGDGNKIELLSGELAAAKAGGTPKNGYFFKDCDTKGGRKIDQVNDFALCATPAKYGSTGRKTMLISSSGTVWGKDLGKASFVADFPANPASAGWAKVR